MSKEQFVDLEKTKVEILKEKAEIGISEFKEDSSKQWTELRFEKPLLEKLLSLIEQAEKNITCQEVLGLQKEALKGLLEQNKRYKEVLEFYADENTYKDIKYKMIYMDGVPTEPQSGEPALIKLDEGAKAREILRGLKK